MRWLLHRASAATATCSNAACSFCAQRIRASRLAAWSRLLPALPGAVLVLALLLTQAFIALTTHVDFPTAAKPALELLEANLVPVGPKFLCIGGMLVCGMLLLYGAQEFLVSVIRTALKDRAS